MSDDQISRQMNQGKQYLQAGNLEAAKKCFDEVVRDQPDASEAFYFLSWIAHTEKQPLSACGFLERAYELEPNNKTYLIGLVNIYNQSNQSDKAIRILQSFLESDATHADIHCMYGLALARQKQVEPAIEAFKKGIELNPSEISGYMGLGELLYQVTQFREAQKVYLAAIGQGLKSEGLYLNVAKLHVDFGEFEQAKAILAEAVEAYPNNLVFAYRLASLDRQSLTQSLKETLLGLDDQSLAPDQQFFRHWLLASFSAQNNESMDEMNSLAKAHKIYEEITPFKRDASFYLERLPQFTPPAEMSRKERKEASKDSPIFIVGMPRCGSTLIENILCAGPTKLAKGEETGAIFQAVSSTVESGKDGFWLRLREHVEGTFQKHSLLDGGTRFTDKSLENIFLLEFIFGLYPNAKVIYCDRTPLASIVSIMKNNMAQLPWAHDVENILRYADNCLNVLDKWSKKYPSNFIKIQYEALVNNPLEESKKIYAFCDLPWDESCLDYYKAEGVNVRTASHIQVRNEINTEAVSAYQAYLPFFEAYKSSYPWLD